MSATLELMTTSVCKYGFYSKVRLTEKPMLDPTYDTDPIAKVELYGEYAEEWTDITGSLTRAQYDGLLWEFTQHLRHMYDDDTLELEPMGVPI
jgi:hypothetical protein